MKSFRKFIDNQKESNSVVIVTVSSYGDVSLTLGDCHKTVTWEFGKVDTKGRRGYKKIKAVKAIVDEIYAHYEKGLELPTKINNPWDF